MFTSRSPSPRFYMTSVHATIKNKKDNTFIPQDWDSLFIPCLPPCLINEEYISYIAENILHIGSVKRVDIVKKENSNNRYMAFIHFNHWNNNANIEYLREKIEHEGQVDVYGIFDNTCNFPYVDFKYLLSHMKGLENLNNNFFIRFFKNKTPIKETELNIHQLADLLEQAKKVNEDNIMVITQMKNEMDQLKEKLAFYEKKEMMQSDEKESTHSDSTDTTLSENSFIQSSYL